MTRLGLADHRDPAGRFNPGMSGNPAGRRPKPGQLPTLTILVKERIMAAASRQVPAIGEDADGGTVSLFEGCVEVLGSAREGNRKEAADYVRIVRLAATSVRAPEPFPELESQENIVAIMTQGAEEEFETLLASQQEFFKRFVAEYSDGELGTALGRLRHAKWRRRSE